MCITKNKLLFTPTINTAKQNVFFNRGCKEWKTKIGTSKSPTCSIFQSAWDKSLCQKWLNDLIESAPRECERARLQVVSSEGASAFLNALPLASCSLKLSNIEMPVVCSLCNISRIRQTILDDPQDNPKCPRHHPDVQPGEKNQQRQQPSPERSKSGTLCNYTKVIP